MVLSVWNELQLVIRALAEMKIADRKYQHSLY
jgi:hypothetical protein